MAKFKTLSQDIADVREKRIVDFWQDMDLLKRSVEIREGKDDFIFYEGPPTANGKPGIHHVMARTLKDLTCRYKTMQGYRVNRKAGWDTHGLPVEIEVEKKLNLHNKQDIEKYGIEKFNKKCRESVFEYEGLWRKMTARMGYLVDLDDPYITLNNTYIESVWHILDKMFNDGLIYEGHKILPYCPRCGTGLASHEVAQGYQEDKTPTITMKFKAVDEDAYFLAWTTTPWTVPSNVALAVHPDVDYAKVKYADGNVYYLAKNLLDKVLKDEYEVLDVLKGKDLEGRRYEQLIDQIHVDGNAFVVVLADYVTTEDGTGIVHTAPAFGEDDYQTGRRNDLAFVKPVDDDGNFTETQWKGQFVHSVNEEIIDYLKMQDKVFSKETIVHNYPHCWRCKTPLIYYAHPSWYIEVTKMKDQLVKNNNGVDWYPDFVGEKRFGNWLENLNDWAISRSRYWGTPFPIWRCPDCGKLRSIGSIKQLVEESIEDIDETIELHRPYVDDVHLRCECGGAMERETDVIDCWFDSGAMPFAQWHYPFEHKEDFDKLFPADFISEGIDQTRGWFYSLLAISTYMTGKAPYKSVLVNDLILDKDGKKMSKSRGNTVSPTELFEEYGADAVRWYLMYVSPPWTPTKFDEDGLREVNGKFFRSLRNIHNFFTMYANINDVDPREITDVTYDEIDRWMLSKYNSLLKSVIENMEIHEVTKVVRDIQDFVAEDLSNWYIRRNRRRFWDEADTPSRDAVFKTTYDILLGIAKMIAPFAPFIAEEFYQTLDGGESVHLTDYPTVDESAIDEKLEEKMAIVRQLVTLGRAGRENAKIKVRQPLGEVLVDGDLKPIIGDLTDLIKEELNVKELVFSDDLTEYMTYSLKPNFQEVGRKFGPKIKDFQKNLAASDAKALYDELKKGSVTMNLNGEDTEVSLDDVLVDISSKEGFDVCMEDNLFVILDTELTEELIAEGYVREFISKVQKQRKANDYEVTDHIAIAYDAEGDVKAALEEAKEQIMEETLAESMELKSVDAKKTDLNDGTIAFVLERI